MDSAARPNVSIPSRSRLLFLVVALGVIGYVIFLARNVASFASGSDASGYFNSARLLARGRFFAAPRVPAGAGHLDFGLMAFQPLGFTMDEKVPRMAPTYPSGLPLHLLLASRLSGWRHAATVVNIAATLVTGFLLWLLARRLALPPAWAAAGVAALWFCPVYVFSVLQPMSDVLALGWSLAALYLALRARDHRGWAAGCGAAVSIAVLVRPTDLLLIVPVAVAFGLDWRRYLLLASGALPGAVFFACYNQAVYGSPLATGYGDVSTVFSPGFVAHNLTHFAHWLPVLLTPLVCAALVTLMLPAARRRDFAVLGIWTGVLVGFYAFYYHSGETWWYLRFLLPAFPALILAALFAVHSLVGSLLSRPAWLRPVVALALLVFVIGWSIRQNRRLEVTGIPREERFYLDTAAWARAHLPPEAAVLCMQVSGSLYYYTDLLVIRWDQVRADKIDALLGLLRHEQRPVYAALYDFEEAGFRARIGGHWEKLGSVGNTTFWQLPAPP